MVDVAAIFDEVFGSDERTQGSSENRCARCVGVPAGDKPFESNKITGTPAGAHGHTLSSEVCPQQTEGVPDILLNINSLLEQGTRAHRAHQKSKTPAGVPDIDAFEERAAVIEHDGEHPRQEAETRAAREQGFADADDLHGAAVARWTAEIDRLADLRAVSREGAEALRRARAFIRNRWALQAARLGWDEYQLFGVCPRAPWARLDRKGVAFGGAVRAMTADMVVHVGGLRRYRMDVNNDGGAVPIWELARREHEGDAR